MAQVQQTTTLPALARHRSGRDAQDETGISKLLVLLLVVLVLLERAMRLEQLLAITPMPPNQNMVNHMVTQVITTIDSRYLTSYQHKNALQVTII